jgi:hypothetical protein
MGELKVPGSESEPKRLPENMSTLLLNALQSMEYFLKYDQPLSEKALRSVGLDNPVYQIRVFDRDGDVLGGFEFGLIKPDDKLILVRNTAGVYLYVQREAFGTFEQTLKQIMARLQ